MSVLQDLESTVNVQRILDALGDVDHDDLSELAGLVDVRPHATHLTQIPGPLDALIISGVC